MAFSEREGGRRGEGGREGGRKERRGRKGEREGGREERRGGRRGEGGRERGREWGRDLSAMEDCQCCYSYSTIFISRVMVCFTADVKQCCDRSSVVTEVVL